MEDTKIFGYIFVVVLSIVIIRSIRSLFKPLDLSEKEHKRITRISSWIFVIILNLILVFLNAFISEHFPPWNKLLTQSPELFLAILYVLIIPGISIFIVTKIGGFDEIPYKRGKEEK